jgi:hypothetical protein
VKVTSSGKEGRLMCKTPLHKDISKSYESGKR